MQRDAVEHDGGRLALVTRGGAASPPMQRKYKRTQRTKPRRVRALHQTAVSAAASGVPNSSLFVCQPPKVNTNALIMTWLPTPSVVISAPSGLAVTPNMKPALLQLRNMPLSSLLALTNCTCAARR